MGVSDARHGEGGLILGAILAVKLLVHVPACHADRRKESLGGDLIQIQEIKGVAEHIDDVAVLAAVLVQIAQGVEGSIDVVPQLLHLTVQLEQLQNEGGRGGHDARIGVQNDLVLTARGEIQSSMVDVHALYHLAVHVGDELGVVGIPSAGEIGDDLDEHVIGITVRRDGHLELEPCVAIVAVAPGVLEGIKGNEGVIRREFPCGLVLTGTVPDVGDPTEGVRPMFVEYVQISGDLFVQSFHSRLLAPLHYFLIVSHTSIVKNYTITEWPCQ